MRNPFATAVAIAVGLLTLLLGYLLPAAFTNIPVALEIRSLMIGWAVNLAAIAALVAILSLVSVHIRKVQAKRNADLYSLLTLLFFIITVIAGCVAYGLGIYRSEYQQVFVIGFQAPVEASLMAVLSVTLILACFRLFQRRHGMIAITFLLSTLVFLLFNSGMFSLLEPILPPGFLGDFLGLLQILPLAGGRGILLGIALGSMLAGLRVLFGADRPYTG